MSSALQPRLKTLLLQLAKLRPEIKLPFIVTLAPGARASEVLPFTPTIEVETIRMAAGEMTAQQALDLATNAQVETIEHDGQAQAIEALLHTP